MIIWPTEKETEVLVLLNKNGALYPKEIVVRSEGLIKPVSVRGILERMEKKGLIVCCEGGCELTDLGQKLASLWTEFGGGPA